MMETASLFLSDEAPVLATARLLRALSDAGLVDGGVGALPEQAQTDGPLAAALRAGEGVPVEKVAVALERTVSTAPPRELNVYFRLPVPETLPQEWRDELEDITGQLEPDPGSLWVTHPFECWLALDLGDVEGRGLAKTLSSLRASPHPLLPGALRVVGHEGDEAIDVATGLELRTQPANVPYLLLALEKADQVAGRRVLLRILD